MTNVVGFTEWRSQNRVTRYPFSEQSTLTSDDDKILLEGIFIDAILYPQGNAAGLFLSAITITADTVTFEISTDTVKGICTGIVTNIASADRVELVDSVGRPAGLLLSEGGNLKAVRAMGLGTHNFVRTAAEFCATVSVPTPSPSVTGFLLDDGSVVSGRVILFAENGVVIRTAQYPVEPICGTPYLQDNIEFNIIGDPLFRRRLCEGETDYNLPRPITNVEFKIGTKTITLPMTGFNDLQIKASNQAAEDTALRISNTDQGIDISVAG